MTVTIEVAAGHKWCKSCGGVYSREDGFYFKKSTNRSTGTVSCYPESKCKKCANAARAVHGWVKPARPPRPVVNHWPRCPVEHVCDAAFMGWRDVHVTRTGANLGARL